MGHTEKWLDGVRSEFMTAEKARQSGNEGMARVCARRAAGIALGEYFARQDSPDPGPSAIRRLNHLINQPDVRLEDKERAYRLTLRVTEDHVLPVDADLIDDARSLIQSLLGENI